MASSRLPAPGTDLGPCHRGCSHRDCSVTRDMAAVEGFHCDEPIGYERNYYQTEDGLAHASCHEEALDAGLPNG